MSTIGKVALVLFGEVTMSTVPNVFPGTTAVDATLFKLKVLVFAVATPSRSNVALMLIGPANVPLKVSTFMYASIVS